MHTFVIKHSKSLNFCPPQVILKRDSLLYISYGNLLLCMFSSLHFVISPVLIKIRSSFWSKNTQQIKLFHLSLQSLKLIDSKESYARTFELTFDFFEIF